MNRHWTKDELEWLKNHSKGIPRKDLCEMYNKAFNQNVPLSTFIGYCDRKHITNGIDTKKKKGCVGWNKGMKQTDYMSPEAIERTKATRFHKGDNAWPLGSIFVSKYKEVPRLFIKVKGEGHRHKNYELYDKYVWEKETGKKTKAGDVIRHLDGNYLNCDFNNLEYVEQRTHLGLINKKATMEIYNGDNPDLKRDVIAMARLETKVKELGKKR